MALPAPTSDVFETDSNATYEDDLPADWVFLLMELVEKHPAMMPSALHAEVTNSYPEVTKGQVKHKAAKLRKKAPRIITAETESCSKPPVVMSQLTCLSFSNPTGHLGEINVEMDMHMEDLLFQLVQMGMKLPLKLVHNTTVLVFTPTDTVGSALISLPRDVLALPRINLDVVCIVYAERENTCCCGSCSQWWFREDFCCPASSYKRDYAAQLCLWDQWLLAACSAGQISTAQQAYLEMPHCDVNCFVKKGEGKSPRAGPPGAMWRRSATCLNEAVAAGHSELCTLLIAKRANVNKGTFEEEEGYYRGERKETCLYAALKGGHANICQILIDSKAQVNHCWATCSYRNCERDEQWGSALSVAVQQKAGAKLCNLLLEARADPGLGEMRRDGSKGYGKGKGRGEISGDQNLNDDGIMKTSDTLREWSTTYEGPLRVAARRGVDIAQFKAMLAPENDSPERKVAM